MANSKISNFNPSFHQITYLNGKSEIENFLVSVISGENVTFGMVVINNNSKDDIITNLANTSTGLLMVYEGTALWKDHPYFTFITTGGDIWSGTLVYSNGAFSVVSYKHSPS